MIAGVPAAVVSQWQIGDSASKTPRLMRAFYENLKYGKDVATALQSAMIELSVSGLGFTDCPTSPGAMVFTSGSCCQTENRVPEH
jgi:CHAT domain-containing protein